MPKASSGRRMQQSAYQAGTLWSMTRNGWTARCGLWSAGGGWELRVTVESELLFSKRSPRLQNLFLTADRWKQRMVDSGWTKVIPSACSPP